MSQPYLPAISLLEDTIVNLYLPTANGGDSGVRATWGSAVLYGVDKINQKGSLTTADHSAGQNPQPINRGTKFDGEVTIEMKAFVDATQGNMGMFVGEQIKVVGVATLATHTMTSTIIGIITDIEIEISGPSTYKVTIKPYGVDSTFFVTWAYA